MGFRDEVRQPIFGVTTIWVTVMLCYAKISTEYNDSDKVGVYFIIDYNIVLACICRPLIKTRVVFINMSLKGLVRQFFGSNVVWHRFYFLKVALS